MENLLPDRAQHDLTARYLRLATGQAVYDYFEKWDHEPGGNDLFSKKDSDDLFSELLRQRDPLTDLALARFTSHEKTLCELWQRGDPDLCLAIAANRQRHDLFGLTERAISDIAESGDDLLRRLVFRSQTISLDTVTTIFDRENAFARLSDVAWLNVVEAAVFAPCLSARIEWDTRHDSTLDAIRDRMNRDRAFESAWSLLLKISPRPDYAFLLSLLYSDIADVKLPEEMFLTGGEKAELRAELALDLDEDEEDSDDADEGDGDRYSKLLDQGRQRYLDAVFSLWQPTDRDSPESTKREYARLRKVISRRVCGKVDERFLRDHLDAAVRAGFYEGCESLSMDEANAALERDGKHFLEVIARHPWIHRRTEIAELLRKMAGEWAGWDDDGRTAWEKDYREHGIALWQRDPELFAHPDHDHSLPLADAHATQRNDAESRDEVMRRLASLERKTVWIGRSLIFGASAVLFYFGADAIERRWNASQAVAVFVSFFAAVGLAVWLDRTFEKQ
jgi:hypothetical protein